MITLRNVSKSYGKGQPAIDHMDLQIDKGEFVFVVGNSGSGKSTLIKLLLKELEPTEGTIEVNGQILNKLKRRKVPKYRRGVGVVFQDFRLLKDRNVYENVAFAQRVTVDCVKNVNIARKAIKKAFQNQIEGKGYSIVEVLSTCPTNWGMSPVEALKWLNDNMIPYYPLGVYKDVEEGVKK